MDYDEVENILPSQIMFKLNSESRDFIFIKRIGLDKILSEHNKNYTDEIDFITLRGNGDYINDGLSENEYAFYVGKEIVLKGQVSPERNDEEDERAIKKISLDASKVLSENHDRIIQIQKSNEKILQKYEKEKFYEFLYTYYFYHFGRKHEHTFFLLKKLAEKYPQSTYVRTLKRVYRGTFGKRFKNEALAKKLSAKYEQRENF